MSSAMLPGTWAPSASTNVPFAWQAAAMSASGSTSAVVAVMWSTTITRVAGDRPRSIASTNSFGAAPGPGSSIVRRVAPVVRAT